MRRGEMWWAEFPRKRRPVLVLTRDAAVPLLHRITVVPATRTIRGIPSEVRLGLEDGMPQECVLAFDDMATIHRSMFRSRITTLSASRLEDVCNALAYALGCR